MKTIRCAAWALLAGTPVLWAAPRLFVTTPTLAPESGVELILDRAVVPDETVGKTTPNDWLAITPALPGKLSWKAPNVARFLPDQAPALGASYKFAVREGRKHLDQSPVPAGELQEIKSETFGISNPTIRNRWNNDFTPRTAAFLLDFNDDVDPAAASAFFFFENDGRQRVAARVERPATEQLEQFRYRRPSWAQRFAQAQARRDNQPVADAASLNNVLVVTPLTPLPPGKNWRLSILAGLPNAARNASLTEATSAALGDIDALKVASAEARTVANEAPYISVEFNTRLPEQIPADVITRAISVSPELENMRVEVSHNNLHIYGDFSKQANWHIALNAPLASNDGRVLDDRFSKDVVFKPLEPSVALPSDAQSQLADGSRIYRIDTVNLASVRVRIKQLDAASLIRTFQGFRHYTGDGPDDESLSPTHLLPYEMVFGATVVDQVIPIEGELNTSKMLTLEWDKLVPNAPKHAALFLEVSGTPRNGSLVSNEENSEEGENGAPSSKRAVAQACLQLTDIGLAWKLTKESAQVYAFSCATGAPLPGVTLDAFGEDAKALGTQTTNEMGIATLARPKELRHLRARLGDDSYITAFDQNLETVGIWRFPVEFSWNPPPATQRRVFLFTDRSLYRPGETVHLKGIARVQKGNAVENVAAEKSRIIIRDPENKVVRDEALTLSSNGSFDVSFDAPAERTGTYTAVIEFTDDLAKAEAMSEEDYDAKETLTSNARFELPIRVEEFRRNAFETEASFAPVAAGATTVNAALQANYYQGQAVAAGGVKHYTHIADTNFYPDRFRDYVFGNHRNTDYYYWSYYFGYSGGDDEDESDSGLPGNTVNGEATLSADGKVNVPITLSNSEFPSAKKVSLRAEITDANHQTLNASANITVHPAKVYVGVSRVDRLVRVGDRIPLSVVAVGADGEPFAGNLSVETAISRQVNDAVKVESPSGIGSAVRNEAREEALSKATLDLAGAANAGQGTRFEFAPDKPGLHYITLRGKDADGHAFATVTSLHVYGTKEYPWAYEDGMRIKLVPEKKFYQAGESARVLVLSPIEGKALVTIERDKVLRTQVIDLKADNPVIEVPVGHDDAPNVFVSVLVIKGAQDSAREHKEPQLRLGYCTLKVQSPRNHLAVAMELKGDDATPATKTLPVSYRPASEVEVAGSVTTGDGKPAANAEVTLYAEDEGTLAVMGYKNPDPFGYFYKLRQLLIGTGTSLGNFMSEDPETQSFTNKGFFIGGGGELADSVGQLRKDFNPCAAWLPKLVTDANGRFSAKFKIPDTLTRYRLIAVAHQGAEKFGTAQSAFVANKPLMLEVKAPRFANESDRLNPQVLVQNASEWAGTWTIRFSPHKGDSTPVCRALDETTRTVTLEPGASQAVVFPIIAETSGTATLTFRAEPVSLRGVSMTPQLGRKLSDAVEASFAVNYPMPLMRDSRLVKMAANGETNLLNGVDPSLLEGRGEVEVEFARSVLLGAGDSVDYLLHYPYGCVEQTSSSTMPWLAVEPLRPHLPQLAKHTPDAARRALQAGVNRLLSMQLAGGGFSYWPGNGERVDWASSYAGLVLVLASKQEGVNVPESALENVSNDLMTSLRGIAQMKSPYQMEIATRGLWVLALAGKPQDAYHNLLLDHPEQLTPRARAFLALAMNAADPAQKPRAIELLRSKKPFAGKYDGWMTYEADDAIELLAWTTIEPNAPECTEGIDRLMQDRDPYSGWRTTWANSWSVLAVSSYARGTDTKGEAVVVSFDNGTGKEAIELKPGTAPVARKLSFTHGVKLAASAPRAVFARVKLASKPKIAPTQPVAKNGMEVTRIYERVKADGTSEPLDQAKVGDLIRVSLRVTMPSDNSRYIVVEDPLPPMFETVNQEFASQSSVKGGRTSQNDWNVSHSELRSDRAVFFFDRIWYRGTYTVQYLARCTMSGSGTAPAAKVEAMYAPQNVAFSASRRFEIPQ